MSSKAHVSGSALVGLVVAAGRSERMGTGRSKLLEPVDGKPLLVWPVEAMCEAGIDPVLVVTGHDAPAVAEALADSGCRLVQHEGWAEGMGSSIACGARVAARFDLLGLLVCVGDLPGLRSDHVAALLAVFRARDSARDSIVVPTHDGRQGHPVLFGAAFLPELIALEGDDGGRAILEAHAGAIARVEIASDAVVRDVDTPEELAGWRR
ncbi:MAG: 4-diphosphocytidyl-2C-methyl-D-erythritol kinase [Deltaproteobacteria bacterium]|nr:4-diphosphocytidyl-2C-methyl-D-erythritol kinase [Deltaproteobacteria bacterium]